MKYAAHTILVLWASLLILAPCLALSILPWSLSSFPLFNDMGNIRQEPDNGVNQGTSQSPRRPGLWGALLEYGSIVHNANQEVLRLLYNKETKDGSEESAYYTPQDSALWPLDLEQYRGMVVVRVHVYTPANEKAVKSSVYRFCKGGREGLSQCSVWAVGSQFVDVQMKNGIVDSFAKELRLHSSNKAHSNWYEIIIGDLPQLVRESFPKSPSADTRLASAQNDLFFKEYRPLETIYLWFDLLQETYPALVSVRKFGTTYEGKALKALLIDAKRTNRNPTNKTIVIAAGLHAREWISVSSANFLLFQLLTNYGSPNAPETDYLDQLNVLVVPVFNPDGYVHTWNGDRLWRKNRQKTYVPRCFGVDIDHSFGYHWGRKGDGGSGAPMWPCDEDYMGEGPLEALEAKRFQELLYGLSRDHGYEVEGYLDLHSYAQQILYPYAYSCNHEPRDKENLLELAYGLSKAVRLSSGKNYKVFAACKDRNVDVSPGLGSGSSLDFMYSGAFGNDTRKSDSGNGNMAKPKLVKWAFQLKLRDSGSHGFLLPAKYIEPVGNEIYEAVKYFFDFILNPDL